MKKLSSKQLERLKHYHKCFKKELALYDMNNEIYKTIIKQGWYDPQQIIPFDGKDWTLQEYLNHCEEIYQNTFYSK
jgi:hypothetical protein